MRTLGLDLGSKTLGVSVSDALGMIARPVETLRFESDDYDSAFEQVKKYIKEFQITTAVLGLPKHMNGDVGIRLLDGGGVVAEIFHALFLVAEGDVRTQLHELPDERLMADARADKGNLFALDEVCKLLLFLLHKKGPPL